MTNTENKNVVWKTYPDYPFVQANQFGEVRTIDHYTEGKDGRRYFVKGHVLKQYAVKGGYMQIQFSINGKHVHLYVHRVVATCFVSNPNKLPEIDHIDCNPKNNNASNLRWCTRQENITYRDKLGHFVNNNPGKPVIAVNLKTFELFYFESQREAERHLGADNRNINKVLKGQLNKTHGYWFCCVDEKVVENIRTKFFDLAG